MTVLLVATSFAMGALATLALFQLVRPQIGGRMVWPALAAAVASTLVTVGLGWLTDAARLDYLLGVSAFALPVLVLLEAAAIGAGAGRTGRWVLMLLWGLVVFPGAVLVPLILTHDCVGVGCGFVDFGGALPLFVSSSAFMLLARTPAGRVLPGAVRGSEAIAGVLGFWFAFVVWLASLEAAIDAYIPRILLAAVVGPAAGAAGWLVADVLRATGRAPTRSLAYGFLAGIAATVSGAVTVSFPWTAVVGLLAGAAGAVVHGLRPVVRVGTAARWGWTLLAATAIGFLAPPVAGDTIGILFSVQFGVLGTPLLAFVGVAAGSVLVSLVPWLVVRSRAASPVPKPPGADG